MFSSEKGFLFTNTRFGPSDHMMRITGGVLWRTILRRNLVQRSWGGNQLQHRIRGWTCEAVCRKWGVYTAVGEVDGSVGPWS